MTEETFEPDDSEEIEAQFTTEALAMYYQIGLVEGRVEQICKEIDIEQAQRGFVPSGKYANEPCPF